MAGENGTMIRTGWSGQDCATAAVAAKMNIAFDHADGFLCDLPWCMAAAVLRSVLPDLPADMAEALAPPTKGQGTEIQIDEALRAGGTPKHFGDDVLEPTAAGRA